MSSENEKLSEWNMLVIEARILFSVVGIKPELFKQSIVAAIERVGRCEDNPHRLAEMVDWLYRESSSKVNKPIH